MNTKNIRNRLWLHGSMDNIIKWLDVLPIKADKLGVLINSNDDDKRKNQLIDFKKNGGIIALEIHTITDLDASLVSEANILVADGSAAENSSIFSYANKSNVYLGKSITLKSEKYENNLDSKTDDLSLYDIIFLKNINRSDENGFDAERIAFNGRLIKNLTTGKAEIAGIVSAVYDGFNVPFVSADEIKLLLNEVINGGMAVGFECNNSILKCDSTKAALCEALNLSSNLFGFNLYPENDIGIVWDAANLDAYCDCDRWEGIGLPLLGIRHALMKHGYQYSPVNAKKINDFKGKLLIFPEQLYIDDNIEQAILSYIKSGRSIIIIGKSLMFSYNDELRADNEVYKKLGLIITGNETGARLNEKMGANVHSYHEIQLRHPIFDGFEECSVLAFGGQLQLVKSRGVLAQLASWIPGFPISPCELAYIEKREPEQGTIFAGKTGSGATCVYFAGDQDRLYGRDEFADYEKLLINAIDFCIGDAKALSLTGSENLDISIRKTGNAAIIYAVNLTGVSAYGGYIKEVIPAKNVTITYKCGYKQPKVTLIDSSDILQVSNTENGLSICIKEITDHIAIKIAELAYEEG